MWNPKIIDTDKSLYIAIADAMERDIKNGTLNPGDKMPTHRELADIIGVNVTTITRSYKEAARRGLITGTVGRGTYISADTGMDSTMMRIEDKAPRMIEIGLVLPLYMSEPDISGMLEKLSRDKFLKRFLGYTDPMGLPEHRETGAYWMKRFGINASAGDIVICAGAQHALTCCLSSLFEAGDRIAVDYLTYPGIKAAAKTCGIKLEPIHMDMEGMIPEELEAACRRNLVKGVYLMPNMQNPTTVSMPEKRKQKIAHVIEGNGLILIEDDIYSFTNLNSQKAIASIIPEKSVYIAGTSKAFYAGLRVAYVAAPGQYRYKVGQAVVNSIWMAPPLNAEIVSECIRSGTADRIISSKLEEAAKRFAVASEYLQKYSFSGQPGNFFVWLNLPDNWTGRELESAGHRMGINLFCADKFALGGEAAPSAARISLSGPETMDELRLGFDILESILSKGCMCLDTIF